MIYVLACVAVGVVVGRHPPGSPMGWLLLFFTVLLMLSLGGGTTRCSITCLLGYSGGVSRSRSVTGPEVSVAKRVTWQMDHDREPQR